MNILHLSTAVSWRGGEQQVDYLIDSLKPYTRNQYLICVKNSELSKRIKNATIIELEKPNLITNNWAKDIKRVCEKYAIDIIQVHESKSQTYAVLSSILYTISPIVVTRRVIFPVKGWLSKFKYKHASIKKVVCISNAVKDEMKKVVSMDKLMVIPSVVNIREFKFKTVQNFDFLKTDKIKIAYVAALTKEKDHKTFIDVASSLLKQRTDIVFYIVGDGKLKQEIENYVIKKDIQQYFVFTGFVKNIKELVLQFDLLLFTSKSEGLGTTVLDFFAVKKPVVATDSKGVRDIVINNKTGVLCPNEDVESLEKGVLKILNDADFKMAITNNAYDLLMKKYTTQSLGQNYFHLYSLLVKN